MSRDPAENRRFNLVLYVAGESATSETAIANLKKIEELFGEEVAIQVIDMETSPDQARADGVNIAPTLVRKEPTPIRKLIGDLSGHEKVIRFLKKGVDVEEEKVS